MTLIMPVGSPQIVLTTIFLQANITEIIYILFSLLFKSESPPSAAVSYGPKEDDSCLVHTRRTHNFVFDTVDLQN